MPNVKRFIVGFIGVGAMAVTGVGLVAGVASGTPSHAAKPSYVPSNLRTAIQLPLIGANGKPIIGKDGKPIMLSVGGPVPRPSSPPPQNPSATSGVQVGGGQGVTVTIPNMPDLQKARQYAPAQAS
jgi:hypothetical protein